jgi:hypothetical protein
MTTTWMWRALLATLAGAGCQAGYDFQAQLERRADGSLRIAWEGSPSREVDLFRCQGGCPAQLPGYLEQPDPRPPGTALRWQVSQVDGVEAGQGALGSPLTAGAAPPGSTESVALSLPLDRGAYLVRVVQGEGNYFRASWGTAWASLVE